MSRLLTRAQYLASAGDKAGYGFSPAADEPEWGQVAAADRVRWIKDGYGSWIEKERKLVECFESALRKFYDAHEWSFLRPNVTATLRDGEKVVSLPHLSGVEGEISVRNTDGTAGYCSIKNISPFKIAEMHNQNPESTGVPQYASVRSTKGPGQNGQGFEIYVWPEADQDYLLEVQGYVNPEMPDEAHPYPYGGPEHVETILEMTYAMVEERILNIKGIHCSNVPQRLRESMDLDHRKKPKFVGAMVDAMGGSHLRPGPRHYPNVGMTIDDVLYED